MSYERTPERVSRAVARQRQPHDLHGVHAPVPGQRLLLELPQGEVLRGRDGLPEVWQAVEVPSDPWALSVLLSVLRGARLPHSGDDLSQVHDELAALVLGDLPSVVE